MLTLAQSVRPHSLKTFCSYLPMRKVGGERLPQFTMNHSLILELH